MTRLTLLDALAVLVEMVFVALIVSKTVLATRTRAVAAGKGK